VRRTDTHEQASFRLLAIDTASGQERSLVSSSSALFPAGFSPGEGAFYFVEITPGASELRMLAPDGTAVKSAGHLSDDLTRDWTLSPDGARLAFLALSVAGERVTSRAMVLDLASGKVTPAAEAGGDQFGPAWSPRGALSIGEIAADAAAPGPARTNGQPTLPGPVAGFDVPAGWSPDGRFLAVRTFQGSSAATPGSSALAVVGPNNFRKTLASQEVTFIGWVSH
jgi:hypothetical protein